MNYWNTILKLHNIQIPNIKYYIINNVDFEYINNSDLSKEKPLSLYSGGGKIVHTYKNDKYEFFKTKDNINIIYSIKELNNDELMDCVYNLVSKSWNKPFPWKQPHMDWDQLKAARLGLLSESDQILTTKQLTDEQKAAMEVYRQKLRDFPDTFAGIDPWKVSFPEIPDGVR